MATKCKLCHKESPGCDEWFGRTGYCSEAAAKELCLHCFVTCLPVEIKYHDDTWETRKVISVFRDGSRRRISGQYFQYLPNNHLVYNELVVSDTY